MVISLRDSFDQPKPPAIVQPWTVRLAAKIRRLALPIVLLGSLLLWFNYGMLGVPSGMDTMIDSHPPGTRCLIAKRPSSVRQGAVVFVDLPQGGTLLARVAAVDDRGNLSLSCDNPRSPYARELDELGAVAPSAVRALVLVAFTPTPGAPGGR